MSDEENQIRKLREEIKRMDIFVANFVYQFEGLAAWWCGLSLEEAKAAGCRLKERDEK